MTNSVLMVGPHLASMIPDLEPELQVHRLWEAEDQQSFLREIAPGLRAIATDAWAGASAELMGALPDLKLVANFGVGYDTTDVDYATANGIKVTNTPGVLDDDVADLAIALMLSVCRRIPQADQFVRQGRWHDGTFPLTTKLTGKKLGILGLGRIGKAVARRAEAFDLDIRYHGRHQQVDQPYRYYPSLIELARDVDILLVLIPENAETRGLVSRGVLEALGPEGMLINVARGAIVDEAALVDCLVSGALGGAGLDVFAREGEAPEALFALDNVVLLPHVGSATHETRRAMGMLVVDNLRAFFRGEPLLTPVN